MDAVRVALLREVLAGTEWLAATRQFAGALRASVGPRAGGLLLVGSETYEPWHLAAHLDDEAAWSGLPELSPVLVRHRVPYSAPAHLSVGLGRIEAVGRNETLLVVTPEQPGAPLLERAQDARRAGATVLAMDSGPCGASHGGHDGHNGHDGPQCTPRGGASGSGRSELRGIAHETLTANADEIDLDTLQHLVSASAGENTPGAYGPGGTYRAPASGRRRFRDRLSRLADHLTAPPGSRW